MVLGGVVCLLMIVDMSKPYITIADSISEWPNYLHFRHNAKKQSVTGKGSTNLKFTKNTVYKAHLQQHVVSPKPFLRGSKSRRRSAPESEKKRAQNDGSHSIQNSNEAEQVPLWGHWAQQMRWNVGHFTAYLDGNNNKQTTTNKQTNKQTTTTRYKQKLQPRYNTSCSFVSTRG